MTSNGGALRHGFGRALLAAALAWSSALPAHHNSQAEFGPFGSKTIYVEGTIVGIDWGNPHISIDIRTTGGNLPARQNWRLVSHPVRIMNEYGFEREDFAVGDGVKLYGWPHLRRQPLMWPRAIQVNDGPMRSNLRFTDMIDIARGAFASMNIQAPLNLNGSPPERAGADTVRKLREMGLLDENGLMIWPPPSMSPVVGFMHAIHATGDVETTLAFYTEVFGLSTEVRPFPNDAVPILTNSPGVRLRVAMLRLPGNGFNFELTEFTNVERHAAVPQIADPGAPHMKFLVRDIEPVVAAVRRLGAPILTRSGAPVTVETTPGESEAIFFRDPDGYIVEAIEADPPADAPDGNVIGSIMGVTVVDLDESSAFWRGLLGFELTGDAGFSTDPAALDLMGIEEGGSFRTVAGVVPSSNARIELTEFAGMPRRPFDLRVPDPGASGMAIRVADIAGLLERMKAAGVRVISRDGELVEWSPTVRNVFVKDPNGLNVELVGEIPP